MGLVSSALGAAKSVAGVTAGGVIASGIQYLANRQLQDDAQDFSRDSYKHRHQWEVADLRKAGLNPVLSANAGGSAPSGTGTNVSAPVNPVTAAMALRKMKADIALTEQSARRTSNEADKIAPAADVGRSVSGGLKKIGSNSARAVKGLFELGAYNRQRNKELGEWRTAPVGGTPRSTTIGTYDGWKSSN